jgi:hypothetical protein
MSIPRYYESEDTFETIHHKLKQYPCPFCRLIGCLILHGFLFGYSDVDCGCTIKRGHRIFCSNRNDRKGCGRTLSIHLSDFIKHFLFTARTVWRFLLAVAEGMCKMTALNDTGASASQSAPYRLWIRLHANAAHIRTCLSRVSPPPDTCSSDPEIQTIKHLQAAFAGFENPISAFQLAYETSFFEVLPPKPGMIRS